MHTEDSILKRIQNKLSVFDYLVLAGGGINLIVICIIVFYWVTQ